MIRVNHNTVPPIYSVRRDNGSHDTIMVSKPMTVIIDLWNNFPIVWNLADKAIWSSYRYLPESEYLEELLPSTVIQLIWQYHYYETLICQIQSNSNNICGPTDYGPTTSKVIIWVGECIISPFINAVSETSASDTKITVPETSSIASSTSDTTLPIPPKVILSQTTTQVRNQKTFKSTIASDNEVITIHAEFIVVDVKEVPCHLSCVYAKNSAETNPLANPSRCPPSWSLGSMITGSFFKVNPCKRKQRKIVRA